jgi:transcriptional regulator with XRE-family HTH domain
MQLTARECRMARAALGIGVRELAKFADISPNTVARLERGEVLHRRTVAHVRAAFEAQGIVFMATGGLGETVAYAPGRPLSGRAKLLSDLLDFPDFHFKPKLVYRSLLDIFEAYLDIIRDENREPDAWERQDLNGVVNALRRCDLYTAYSHMIRGITPPDNQSHDYPHPNDNPDSFSGLDMAYFRDALHYLRSTEYTDRYANNPTPQLTPME